VNHSNLRFGVYDKKEVSVVLSLIGDFAKSSLLWSDNSSLVEIFHNHFELLWQTSAGALPLRKRKQRERAQRAFPS